MGLIKLVIMVIGYLVKITQRRVVPNDEMVKCVKCRKEARKSQMSLATVRIRRHGKKDIVKIVYYCRDQPDHHPNR
jgi:hypothetical protein